MGSRATGLKLSLSILLTVGLLAPLGRMSPTFALFSASRSTGLSVVAPSAAPPLVSPTGADIGILRVGDRCENASLVWVHNTSSWGQALHVTASGWLSDDAVTVSPSYLGAGQKAIISFTKAAVGPPLEITGEIRLSVHPGSHMITVPLHGKVINPSGAASEDYPLLDGCISTPRPSGSLPGIGALEEEAPLVTEGEESDSDPEPEPEPDSEPKEPEPEPDSESEPEPKEPEPKEPE